MQGENAAKRKFKVYPSAYANAYASKICAGKIKDPSGLKRKDLKVLKRKCQVKEWVSHKVKLLKVVVLLWRIEKKELELLSNKYKKPKGKRPEEV